MRDEETGAPTSPSAATVPLGGARARPERRRRDGARDGADSDGSGSDAAEGGAGAGREGAVNGDASAPAFSAGVMEPARIPGHGSVPAPVARRWIRDADEGSVWLRRLYTSPDGRDLVAMDSRRRVFTGLLRRMLVLRDDRCTTAWCDGIVAHADHATPARDRGATDFATGNGKCARCNYGKEAPGWVTTVVSPGPPRHPRLASGSRGRRASAPCGFPRRFRRRNRGPHRTSSRSPHRSAGGTARSPHPFSVGGGRSGRRAPAGPPRPDRPAPAHRPEAIGLTAGRPEAGPTTHTEPQAGDLLRPDATLWLR